LEFVHKRLVLRLHWPLDVGRLNSLRRDFADILADGEFRQTGAIVGESLRPELTALTRLVFHFNRRSLGRLRQLIDTINSCEST
jgi:hypothetical protein